MSFYGLVLRLCHHHDSFLMHDRCTALPNDIDGPRGRRTRAFTDELMDTLDSKTLWDEYGIDDDILVCNSFLMIFCSDLSCELALYLRLSSR